MVYSLARFVWGGKPATFMMMIFVMLVVPKYADHLWRCQSVELSVDDLRTSRGVVLGRAVPMLRSVETQPLTGGFVMLVWRILQVIRDGIGMAPNISFFYVFFLYFLQGNAQSDTAYTLTWKEKKEKIITSSRVMIQWYNHQKKLTLKIFPFPLKKCAVWHCLST